MKLSKRKSRKNYPSAKQPKKVILHEIKCVRLQRQKQFNRAFRTEPLNCLQLASTHDIPEMNTLFLLQQSNIKIY